MFIYYLISFFLLFLAGWCNCIRSNRKTVLIPDILRSCSNPIFPGHIYISKLFYYPNLF
ncbi:hypothetical protein MmTuc01_0449 [Methanosarcina mazei Tuc01]|uniref:Uncharacterized protein n=1 Tax=Methanosarcina mazei Tuc01 TaxID=1236903 RepID=M1Q0U3_METMZ|nr:hypothetical protein MmTuc01_0449 [Methanosarcina mazei Tuc01]